MVASQNQPAIPQEIEQFREQIRVSEPPILGISWLQPVYLISVILLTWALALSKISEPTWQDWMAFPVVWVIASFFEYWFHRFPLHRRSWPLEHVYDIHTKMHHRFYQWPFITMQSLNDIRSILFPWWAIFVHVAITGALSWFLLEPLFGQNFAWLVFASASAYMGFYEVIHMLCHMDEKHWTMKIPGVYWLRLHHGLHHVPEYMMTKNFNVVLPLGDIVFRTMTSKIPNK